MNKVEQDKKTHAKNKTYLKIANVRMFSFLNSKEKTVHASCLLFYNFVRAEGVQQFLFL